MAAVIVLFSRGGAHFDNIATNAGNATPYTQPVPNHQKTAPSSVLAKGLAGNMTSSTKPKVHCKSAAAGPSNGDRQLHGEIGEVWTCGF